MPFRNFSDKGINKELPINIYWFSGSGNSLIIAITIEETLTASGYKVQLIPLEAANPASVGLNAVIGIVVPVAGQGTYPFIWEFLDGLPTSNGTPCFFVDTLAIYSGGILGPVKKILQRKGYKPLAAKEILMPNIFQKLKSRPAREQKIIDKGKKTAQQFCGKLINGRGSWWDIPGYSYLLSLMYRYRKLVVSWAKMFPLVIREEQCSRCGICIKLCPEKSLVQDSEKRVIVDYAKCTLCHRCFAFCPSGAVTIGTRKAVVYRALPLKKLLGYLNSACKDRIQI